MSDTRQHVHELVDQFDGVDDETVAAEEAAALDEAHASIARGEGIPHEEIFSEFGLKR